MLIALNEFKDINLIFTMPNVDVGNKKIVQKIKLLRWWNYLSPIHIFILVLFKYSQNSVLVNLSSEKPNLFLFQFYKLGFFTQLQRDFIKKSK